MIEARRESNPEAIDSRHESQIVVGQPVLRWLIINVEANRMREDLAERRQLRELVCRCATAESVNPLEDEHRGKRGGLFVTTVRRCRASLEERRRGRSEPDLTRQRDGDDRIVESATDDGVVGPESIPSSSERLSERG